MYVVQASLELGDLPVSASSAGITTVHYHTQPKTYFLRSHFFFFFETRPFWVLGLLVWKALWFFFFFMFSRDSYIYPFVRFKLKENDLKLLICQPPSPKYWENRCARPCQVFCSAGDHIRASCMLDNYSYNWATFPALLFKFQSMDVLPACTPFYHMHAVPKEARRRH